MKFNIEIIDRQSFVQVKFFGVWSNYNSKNIFSEMQSSISSSGHKKVMFDYTESGFMEGSPLMDNEEAKLLSEIPNVGNYKFASVFKTEDEVARFKLWEIIASKMHVIIKFFDNEEEAVSWLLG